MDEDLNQFTPEQVEAIEKIMLEEDRRGYFEHKTAVATKMTVTWTPVVAATGYQVFRTPVGDDGPIRRFFAQQRAARKKLNKRKHAARARTGRRK